MFRHCIPGIVGVHVQLDGGASVLTGVMPVSVSVKVVPSIDAQPAGAFTTPCFVVRWSCPRTLRPGTPLHVIVQLVLYEEYFPPWADGIAVDIIAATAIREIEISFFVILLYSSFRLLLTSEFALSDTRTKPDSSGSEFLRICSFKSVCKS